MQLERHAVRKVTLIKFQNCARDAVGGFDFEDSHGFDVGQVAGLVASRR